MVQVNEVPQDINSLLQAIGRTYKTKDYRVDAIKSLGSRVKELINSNEITQQEIDRVINALFDTIRNDPSTVEVRPAAVRALGIIGQDSDNVIGFLIRRLKDTDAKYVLAETAQDILIEFGNKANPNHNIIPGLITALNSHSQQTRVLAAETLGKIDKNDDNIKNALLNGLNDTDYNVRTACINALLALRHYGYSNQVVERLLSLKNNDPTTTVQDAARIALSNSPMDVITFIFTLQGEAELAQYIIANLNRKIAGNNQPSIAQNRYPMLNQRAQVSNQQQAADTNDNNNVPQLQ